ncbi:aminoglycoside phosphotransferase family protein [Clostridium manihotivorum]|uniref:Aminoglycoside phosphotransferase domain-containing protein n=1 Tax=Clostridium manihotivorum TaxID=2320868 RepID=A0A410DTJ8_9CLOT|nr:aminoglycoside phosphotransferase family protein [Clostridium manihotivorum]QAA32361.1 hypothetical protein C1I91_12325 [Clostridium manihotivorum]
MILGELLGSGGSSEVYAYTEDKIVKLYYEGYLKDNVVWEFEKTKNAGDQGLPAPKVYEMIEHDGRYGIVMERIDGTSFMDCMYQFIINFEGREITGNEVNQSPEMNYVIKETARLLYNLHCTKADLMDTMSSSMTRMVENNTYLTSEEKDYVKNMIDALPQGDYVCHGDPNPGNIIKTNDTTRLIDWVSCVNGHPLYDLAEYILMFEYGELPPDTPAYIIEFISKNNQSMIDIFLNEYSRLSNLDLTNIDAFIIPMLASKLGGGSSERQKEFILKKIRSGLNIA